MLSSIKPLLNFISQVKKKASVADGLDLQQLEGLTVSVRELHKTHSHLRMTVTSQVEILRELLVDVSFMAVTHM